MERSEGSRNKPPTHPSGIEINTGRSRQRNSNANQILAIKTGCHSVPSVYGNKDGHLLHSRIQKDEICYRLRSILIRVRSRADLVVKADVRSSGGVGLTSDV